MPLQREGNLSYAVEAYGLTKHFISRKSPLDYLPHSRKQEIVAVHEVSFQIRAGELFGLLGPNGAGKTTLLKLLSTLILPTAGKARVNGYDLRNEGKVKAAIGLVTGHERGLYWRLTGRENLQFFASLSGLSPIQTKNRIKELSVLLDLEEFMDRRFDQCSSGMKQRLALARGMLHHPQILFLDEPTLTLDPSAAAHLRETISDLVYRHGHTILLITHNLYEAEQLCDRVAIMNRGQLRGVDKVDHLRKMVQQENRYQIEVTGLSPSALECLKHIHGLSDLTLEHPVSCGPVLVGLYPSDSQKHIPAIMKAIYERGGQIKSLQVKEPSLEEVFRYLTKSDERHEPSPVGEAPISAAHDNPGSSSPSHRSSFNLNSKLLTAFSFLQRDFRLQISYRFGFFLQFAAILLSLPSFYFLSLLVGQGVIPKLEAYGGDYFAFVLVGMAFMGYQNVALNSFSRTIRSEQMLGTLEPILMTPHRLPVILISSSLWNFVFTCFEVFLYLLLGITLFGLRLERVSLAGAFLTQLLTILAFSGIGILLASFIVVFKQETPINFLFASISGLLAGVLYPVEVLPGWLQSLSNLLPLTYSLRAMRKTILLGDSLNGISTDLMVLGLFACILLPLGFSAFHYAICRAKVDGSLTQF
jgi:ABC-type multidrug transport system ATPase subunit/ABC-type multidrug transport system permease subunit